MEKKNNEDKRSKGKKEVKRRGDKENMNECEKLSLAF
jgi:hypothetical protein